jgi:hypothetical protein
MGNRQPARCNKHFHTLFDFLHIAKHWSLFQTEEIGLYLRAMDAAAHLKLDCPPS